MLGLVFSEGGKRGTSVRCDAARLEDASIRTTDGELIATFSGHHWLRYGQRYPRVYCRRCTRVEAEEATQAVQSVSLNGASLFVNRRVFAVYNPELNRWALAPERTLARSIVLHPASSS